MNIVEHARAEFAKRVAQLVTWVEQSAANHNALAGRLAEAKEALANFEKSITEAENAVESTTPAPAAPASTPPSTVN
jgi:hypothetical protein